MLEVLEYDDDKMLINLCNWESLIYWSCLIEYAKTNDIDDLIEYILPDAVNLCGRIKKFVFELQIDYFLNFLSKTKKNFFFVDVL